ncbi:MAG: hypothetical protein AAFU61_18420, partial [Pseudomonadota bacterium]
MAQQAPAAAGELASFLVCLSCYTDRDLEAMSCEEWQHLVEEVDGHRARMGQLLEQLDADVRARRRAADSCGRRAKVGRRSLARVLGSVTYSSQGGLCGACLAAPFH